MKQLNFVFILFFHFSFAWIELSTSNFIVKSHKEETSKYTPDWDSLDSRPLPQWYDDAKVGIFIHWGVYSVPSFGSEWFWWNWRGLQNKNYTNYMEKFYKPGFTYQEFAKDFTAELWKPDDWVKLFEESGAKYIVLTSKHHDGYALWPNSYSFSWNSADIGPHRDLIGELRTAVQKSKQLKFGLYHSLYEWFNPLYLSDKGGNFSDHKFVKSKIIPEMMELIEKYQPEVLWSDGEWEASDDYWQSKEFLAWLYNSSPVRDSIVTNDRWGNQDLCKHGDFYTCTDRYNPGVLQKHKWENAMTLDKLSWGHRLNIDFSDFLTIEELISEIVTTVSCNGNILINVGPTNVGTIEPIFIERLKQMGHWLKINGEAIYNSRPWVYQNDSQTEDVWYTAAPSDENSPVQVVYANVLKYPFDTNFVVLTAPTQFYDEGKVNLLGYPDTLEVLASKDSVIVKLPPKNLIDKYELKWAWTIRLEINKALLL